MRYDLIVLGHDQHGRQAALHAAERGKRVALIECRDHNATHGDSIRAAAKLVTDQLCRQETMRQLWRAVDEVTQLNTTLFETRFAQLGGKLIDGQARFASPRELEIATHPSGSLRLTAEYIVLAVGTKPIRPDWVPFDGRTILDRDELPALPSLPKSIIVIGANPAALESVMFLAKLGTRVVFVDAAPQLLATWDRAVIRRFRRQAARCGVRFRLGRAVQAIEKTIDDRVAVQLEGGQQLRSERVLYAAGCCGNTNSLNLLAAGLQSDEQGRLWCNEHGQTWARHIYGIGDVVGFPEVSQVSLDQAGRVLRHAFGDDGQGCSAPAFGLKTICGLAMCGATEERLRDDLVAYEVGTARFVDDSYRPSGEGRGFLKLLFHRESLELLGVHCLSESAVELIRLGQIVMSLGGTIEAFRDKNFQGVPLSDCYRLAAEDGFARIAGESADCQPRSQTGSCRSSASCRRPALSPR